MLKLKQETNQKNVRNHLCVMNSMLSDVSATKRKEPVNKNVLDFTQLFSAEEFPNVLNTMNESGI